RYLGHCSLGNDPITELGQGLTARSPPRNVPHRSNPIGEVPGNCPEFPEVDCGTQRRCPVPRTRNAAAMSVPTRRQRDAHPQQESACIDRPPRLDEAASRTTFEY